MLYKSTIEAPTLELLNRLMADKAMFDFILVGDTALALQLGHRFSIDIDLFSATSFDENLLVDHLRSDYHFELDFITRNTIKGEINGVQVDFIAHQYPWINTPTTIDNIRLADFSDIAAMKTNAIAGNGTRLKDFIDVAFLSCRLSLNEMLEAYRFKYKSNPLVPLKAVAYFDDINFNEPINMNGATTFDWKKIEARLKKMQDFPNKVFKDVP